jgi:hypothetical protein
VERQANADGTPEQWARLWAAVAPEAPHPITTGELGEFAVLLRRRGASAAVRAYPHVAAHLGLSDDPAAAAALGAELPVAVAAATGRLRARCQDCADHLEDLLVFADDEAARTPRPWLQAVRQTALRHTTPMQFAQFRAMVREAPAPAEEAAPRVELPRDKRRVLQQFGPRLAAAPSEPGYEYYAVPAYPQVRLGIADQSNGTVLALLPVQGGAEYHFMADRDSGQVDAMASPAAPAAPAAPASPVPSLAGWEVRVTLPVRGALSATTAVTDERGSVFLEGLSPSALETARVEVRPPPGPPPADS